MENSKDQPNKPDSKNASAPHTTIKQHIILPNSGSSSPSTNSSPSSQGPHVSNYIQPANIPVSTIIANCNNISAPIENNNIIQTVDIVVKPKNSQLVDVNVIPTCSQPGDDQNMIIPIQLQFCRETCPNSQKLSEEVTLLHEISKCDKTPVNVVHEPCPKNKQSLENLVVKKSKSETSKGCKNNCEDKCPRKQKSVPEFTDQTKNATPCQSKNKQSDLHAPTQEENIKQCCKQPTRLCTGRCSKENKPVENVNKGKCSRETCPKKHIDHPKEQPIKRSHLLYKVCKPELEQYVECAEPCEETVSEVSDELIPAASPEEEEEEEVRPIPWYKVLHDSQFQETYVCDECDMQESVAVQTELVLGDNLFSRSLNSVTDAEKNVSENLSHHTLEIDTFYLPPAGTLEILVMQRKSDLPDIDQIVAKHVETDKQTVKSPNVIKNKLIIPRKKKKCKDYSSCCKTPEEEEDEEEEPTYQAPIRLPPKKIDFIFGTNCNEHEPYYKPLHNPSPEDDIGPCQTDLEMPWDTILLPVNPNIRHIKPINKPQRPIAEMKSVGSEPCVCKSKIQQERQPTLVESYKSCSVPKLNSTKCISKDGTVKPCSKVNTAEHFTTIIASKGVNPAATMVTKLNLAKPTDSKALTCRYLNSNMNSESDSKRGDAPFAGDDRSMPTSKVDSAPCETSATSIESTAVPLRPDIVFQAFKSCEEELRPLRARLVELQTKLRKLNMPELDCLFMKNAPMTAENPQFCSLPTEITSSDWQTIPRLPYTPNQTVEDPNLSPIYPCGCDTASRYDQTRPMSGASNSPHYFPTLSTIPHYCSGGCGSNQYNPMQQQGGQQFHSIPMGSCYNSSGGTYYSRPGTRGNQMPMQYGSPQNYQPCGNSRGTGYYNSRPNTADPQYAQQIFQSLPMGYSTDQDGRSKWSNMQNNSPESQWADIPMNCRPQYNKPIINDGRPAQWTTIPPNNVARNCIQLSREVPTHDRYKTGPADTSGSGSGTDNRCSKHCAKHKTKVQCRKKTSSRSSARCQRSAQSRRPYSQGSPISIEMKNIYKARMQNFVSPNTPCSCYNSRAPPTQSPCSVHSYSSIPYYSMQVPPNYNAFIPGHFEAIPSTPYYVDNIPYENFQPDFNSTKRCACGRPITAEKPKRRNKGIQKSGRKRTPTRKVRVPSSAVPAASTTSNDSDGKVVKRSCKPKKKGTSRTTNTQSSESVCPFIDAIKSILVIDDKKMIKTGPFDYSYDSSFFTKKFKNVRLHLRVRPSRRNTQ